MAESCSEHGTLSPAKAHDLRPWLDVSADESAPFIHRFQTPRQKYVFDVNTRRIIRVSDTVWDVLEDFGRKDEKAIIARLSPSRSAAEVTAALKEIDSVRREQGLFLSGRPKEVRPPSREKVQRELDNERNQLILNVTEDCNFRCTYCVFGGEYQHQRTHSARAMSWDVARAAIDDFLAHSGDCEDRAISFYGGEPLLNLPLIRQCVGHVREAWPELPVHFSLTTNGSLLKGPAAEFLAAENFTLLISLDGPAEIHDRHRRAKGGGPTWDAIMANIQAFLENHGEYRENGKLRFNAVATRETDLRDTKEFFCSCEMFNDSMGLEVSEQRQTDETANRPESGDPLAVSTEDILRQFIQGHKSGRFNEEYACRSTWVEAATFQKPFVLFHKRGYLSGGLPQTLRFLNTCVPGVRRTFVSVDGDYFACERVVTSSGAAIGNVRDGVDTARVMDLLERWGKANGEQCRHCWCLSICNVGCFATVGDDGVVTADAKRKACAAHRRNMHHLLGHYCGILEENPTAFGYVAEMSFS